MELERRWLHDELGRLVSETDENGNETRFGHDAVGRLISVTDAEDRVTHYTHDALGNLASQRDARGHVTLYEHDAMGRRTAKELPLGQREVQTYTLAGQLERHWPFGADWTDPDEAISHAYETGTTTS